MRYVEKVAKTIDGAVTEALIELGATTDQVDVEILDKGSRGILGFGARNAKVKVTVKEVDLLDELGLSKLSETIDLKAALDTKEVPKKVVKETSKETMKEPSKENFKEIFKEEPKEIVNVVNDSIVKKDFSGSIQKIEIFLQQMLTEMGITATLTTSTVKEKVLINIEAEEASRIIGKRGDTLDALQYICNIVANKEQEGYIKITLDTANYRQKREETLKKLAHKLGKKAAATKKPVTLEPMNPYDRRIIHAALQHNKYVKTHSEGKEPYRKVVISPYYVSKNVNK
jgi:spoIIIJ-associated protein